MPEHIGTGGGTTRGVARQSRLPTADQRHALDHDPERQGDRSRATGSYRLRFWSSATGCRCLSTPRGWRTASARVWITGDGKVVRVNAASGQAMSVIRGPRMFGPAIAATSDGVWVGGADIYAGGQGDKTLMHWIYKIDPRRNTVVRQVYLGSTTALDFAADGGSVWVSGWGGVVKVSRSRPTSLPAALRRRRVVAGADAGRGLGDAAVLGEPPWRTAAPTAAVTASRHVGAAEGNRD